LAKLSLSILTADFAYLAETLALAQRHPCVGWLHMDVMDGDFVPNISFGPPVVKSVAAATELPLDVHLMVTDPGRYAEGFVTERTEYIVVHQEAMTHLDRTLRLVKSFGVKCGAALNPATPPESLDYVFDLLDQVLVMSVNPGFGGQTFLPSALDKIKRLAELRTERGLDFLVAVDGGVNKDNILEIARAGADMIIVGSAVLNAPSPEDELAAYDRLLGAEGGAL
jgi:ribulose-phosphate 3-epimerase